MAWGGGGGWGGGGRVGEVSKLFFINLFFMCTFNLFLDWNRHENYTFGPLLVRSKTVSLITTFGSILP